MYKLPSCRCNNLHLLFIAIGITITTVMAVIIIVTIISILLLFLLLSHGHAPNNRVRKPSGRPPRSCPTTVDFRNFIVFLGPRPWHIEIRHRVNKHPQLICSDLRLSNWKLEDWNYGNRPQSSYLGSIRQVRPSGCLYRDDFAAFHIPIRRRPCQL